MNVSELHQQLVQHIGDHLRGAYRGTQQTTTWDQVLQAAGKMGSPVGEIRNGDDLARVPRNKQLRAVYFPNDPRGPSVRWGDGSRSHATLLRGVNHDYFWRKGDNTQGGKQGYITIDSNGNLTVK